MWATPRAAPMTARQCRSAHISSCAREAGAEVVTPVAAEAMPSGPVAAEAYALMSDAILDAVKRGCDAAMLDLHGAMVAETTADGEGTLLERIRAVAPDLPIAVTCDLHANLTETMVRQLHGAHRLQDLSPCRHVRGRRAGRANSAARDEGRDPPGHGLGAAAAAGADLAHGHR